MRAWIERGARGGSTLVQEMDMEYASALVKLRPGSDDKLEEWRRTIASRLEEAAATSMMEAITASVTMAKPLIDIPRATEG